MNQQHSRSQQQQQQSPRFSSQKNQSLTSELKKILAEQHQRLWSKHQQDLDLIDDIKSYVKSRLSIERDYSNSMSKLSKQHSLFISKKFVLLDSEQRDINSSDSAFQTDNERGRENNKGNDLSNKLMEDNDNLLARRLVNKNGADKPQDPCTLYKTWCEHIKSLESMSKYRSEQFEQLLMINEKLKELRQHKSMIGKKCLDSYLRKVQENLLSSIVDVEKSKKLYYEDESQAKKARENEEKIKKKRSGLLTKFTDLQAKKERTMAQREANDIQSTQARNDYIMALAAGTAHVNHYYSKDLVELMQCIDDGVLDHCKIFMATLCEGDINIHRDALTKTQRWSKMINLTGSSRTNSLFIESEKSYCLQQNNFQLIFEPCNDDPINKVSLEHNADYALQYEIDKWLTWFKKECRKLSQLTHQLETCQKAFADGKKSIDLNGVSIDELESKILDLKQQITRSEAAKLKAQARLLVIKEGGMQIEEWSTIESEIRADEKRAQEIAAAAAYSRQQTLQSSISQQDENSNNNQEDALTAMKQSNLESYMLDSSEQPVLLQVSRNSDDSDSESNQFVSVSRSSTTNLQAKHQNAVSSFSAMVDPNSAWQDGFDSAWSTTNNNQDDKIIIGNNNFEDSNLQHQQGYNLLDTSNAQNNSQQASKTNMTIQSSSPLSAIIIDGNQNTPSPNQQFATDAYKSDYECDYNRNNFQSVASSINPSNPNLCQEDFNGSSIERQQDPISNYENNDNQDSNDVDPNLLLNKRVLTLYPFERNNEDELSFEENEVLVIIGINDEDWIKARNERTGEHGLIPKTFVSMIECSDDVNSNISKNGADIDDFAQETIDLKKQVSIDDSETNNTTNAKSKENRELLFCHALYDYEPNLDTTKHIVDDGLPLLTVKRDEIFKIIDQSTDDGWWVVERDSDGTRGHVPSMLLDELERDDEFDEASDPNSSEPSDIDDGYGDSSRLETMPKFAAPTLPKKEKEGEEVAVCLERTIEANVGFQEEEIENDETSQQVQIEEVMKEGILGKTSYMIIEPTPDVESKTFESIEEGEIEELRSRQRVSSTNELPKNACYAVVDDDFVLNNLERKPSFQQTDGIAIPTLIEEKTPNNEPYETESKLSELAKLNSQSDEEHQEFPPPPVSLVIDTVETINFNEVDDYEYGTNNQNNDDDVVSNDSSSTVASVQKMTSIQDVSLETNMILHEEADKLSKQLITEAIQHAFIIEDNLHKDIC